MLYTGATLCGQKLYVSSHQLAQAKEIVQAYQSKKVTFSMNPTHSRNLMKVNLPILMTRVNLYAHAG